MNTKLINVNHSTHCSEGDAWVASFRQSILDWYTSEMQKEQYKDTDDMAILDNVAIKIADEKESVPIEWLNSATEEIAEGILLIDDWSMSYYELLEYLLAKI